MYKLFHLLILVAVILAFGVSFALLQRVIGIASPWLALLLMFYFLGLVKVAEPLFMLRVPRTLRPLSPWELRGKVNRMLAISAFGRLLRSTPLRYLNSAVYLDRRDRGPLQVCRLAE